MTADPAVELREVARALGVEDGHHDVFGTWHDVSPRALVAVAGVLAGVPGANGNDVVAAGRAELARRAARPVAPTLVAWDGRLAPLELRLAPEVTAVSIAFEVDPRASRSDGAAAGGGPEGQVADAFTSGWSGRPDPVEVVLARHALAVGASGGCRTWRLDLSASVLRGLLPDGPNLDPLPVGRHRLVVEVAGERTTTTVLAAPRRMVGLGEHERLWGVFAPLHSLWSDTRSEPHLGHLARLGEWVASAGGSVVSTLPLLATYLDRPFDPSPYQPVSRRWWNEAYLDLRARPELADCPEAREVLDATPATDPRAPYDAAAHAARQRRAIGLLADHVARAGGTAADALTAFADANPDVVRYARFRAMVERTGTGWQAWEAPARAGELPVDDDAPEVRAHLYAQWATARQLERLGSQLAAQGQRLQLDLPLGAHGDGYDTWVDREQFAWGASAGAPPDEFFVGGQSWGFPPLSPHASSVAGHAHLAISLAAHMAIAGILRIDHVMGLHRLWWVPDGLGPTEGAYVRYPADELLATVAVEAHLSGCVVVGEDLGTVPHEVVSAMDDHAVPGMWVAEFSQGDGPGERLSLPGHDVVASIGTHDTPSWASWVRAGDVALHRSLGLVDDGWADRERARRARQVANLADTLIERGLLDPAHRDLADGEEATEAGHAALLALVGDTDAACVLVSLDDLVGVHEPQNVPGTPADRPNWVLRLDRSLGDLEHDEDLRRRLLALQHARLGSWGRTQS